MSVRSMGYSDRQLVAISAHVHAQREYIAQPSPSTAAALLRARCAVAAAFGGNGPIEDRVKIPKKFLRQARPRGKSI